MPLTDAAIRAAKAKSEQTLKLSDGGGLQLWVTPTGSKLWRLAYRFDGKQKKLAIGVWPAVSLKDARKRREDTKALLASGVDPGQQKKANKAREALERENTFDAIAAELIDKKRREGKTEKTLSKNQWALGFVSPHIGARPVAVIKAPEILAALRTVEARGRHETAVRLRALVGQVFRYAIATGRCESDPTFALRGALTTPVTKHRPAIVEPAPFGGLLRAIEGYAGDPTTRIALQLLALTFVRPGELRNAEWSDFALDAAVWSIPAGRMKMRRPHRVSLAPQAVALLRELHALTGRRRLLFPGLRSVERPISENTLNGALRRLGYAQDQMTAHGFRAAASSMLNESRKWSGDAIERQLAHADPDEVRRAYARADFWPERVEMMKWWADHLATLRRGAEVVPLRRA
ncbi:MAG: integrase arm-type DNA-binding domain-containing protein [Hyphomicrobiales bacterium]|nr:integrase arm-type DNA-binding domain-containing protein [Hyphomicrobiales bacterium]